LRLFSGPSVLGVGPSSTSPAARANDGVRLASEVHELGVFTTDEMLRSFNASGVVAEHDARALAGGAFSWQGLLPNKRRVCSLGGACYGNEGPHSNCGEACNPSRLQRFL
jgi:hypothetical protein